MLTLNVYLLGSFLAVFFDSRSLFYFLDNLTPVVTDPIYPILKTDTPSIWEEAGFVFLDTEEGLNSLKIEILLS